MLSRPNTQIDRDSILQKLKHVIDVPKGDLTRRFENAVLVDEEELADKFNVVIPLGITGSGKSSVLNAICGSKLYKESGNSESETSEPKGVIADCEDFKSQKPTIVIDFPGLGDSMNRDTKHIGEIVTLLKLIGYVNAFLIVINYRDPRFSE